MDSKTDVLPLNQAEELVPETAICIDYHYAYMEAALLAQWEIGNVPDEFKSHPREWIVPTVDSWWSLMVETSCILYKLERTNWERSRPAVEAHDVAGLFGHLKSQFAFIKPRIINKVRELSQTEQLALGAMDAALDFYESKCWPENRHLVDPDDPRFGVIARQLEDEQLGE